MSHQQSLSGGLIKLENSITGKGAQTRRASILAPLYQRRVISSPSSGSSTCLDCLVSRIRNKINIRRVILQLYGVFCIIPPLVYETELHYPEIPWIIRIFRRQSFFDSSKSVYGLLDGSYTYIYTLFQECFELDVDISRFLVWSAKFN